MVALVSSSTGGSGGGGGGGGDRSERRSGSELASLLPVSELAARWRW
jgi:hypothetical protein